MSTVFGASKSQIKPRLNFRQVERFREPGHHFISNSHWQNTYFIALGGLMQKHDQNAYRVSGSQWVFNKCSFQFPSSFILISRSWSISLKGSSNIQVLRNHSQTRPWPRPVRWSEADRQSKASHSQDILYLVTVFVCLFFFFKEKVVS